MKSQINNLILRPKTPPKLYGYQEFNQARIEKVYVPDESIELYRTKWEKWIPFAPLSEYQG